MTRAMREAELVARNAGFRSVADMIDSKRKAERRQAAAVWIGEERRQAERRAKLDSAIVNNWIRRFDAARIGSN